MNIVLVISGFNLGGGELMAVRLAAELHKDASNKVVLLSLFDPVPGVVLSEARAAGLQIRSLEKRAGFHPRTIYTLYKNLKKLSPDVLHTHLGGFRYAVLAALFCHIPTKLHTIHTAPSRDLNLKPRFLSALAFGYLGWTPIVLSAAAKQEFSALYGRQPLVIGNGVPAIVNAPSQRPGRSHLGLGLPEDGRILLMVGRIAGVKNHALAVQAFEQILQTPANSDCHLMIVGNRQEADHTRLLDEQIQRLPVKVAERITLPGTRTDITRIMQACDVLLLTSVQEGLPLVILEAMACKLPIISAAVGGIPDVIEHRRNGLLFGSGDLENLVLCICKLLDDQAFAAVLAENAYRDFLEKFNIVSISNEYLSAYQDSDG